MKIEMPDGRLFSLQVEGYEFPDEVLGPTDDNPANEFETGRFLIVAVSFRNADGAWNASGPIMTTTELKRFADWLDSIRNGNPLSTGVYFTERDLEFAVGDSARKLLVHACRDFVPQWSKSAQCVTIDFPVSQINIIAAVDSLRSQLRAFPGRPPIEPTE